MKVQFNNLGKQWEAIKSEALPRLERLFERSDFIGGQAVEVFEKNFAKYIGTRYAVGVSNGTDAIKLALMSLDLDSGNIKYAGSRSKIGIIVPSHTFIATLLAAEQAYPNAEFIFVDCDKHFQIDVNLLQATVLRNRRKWEHCVILPVHLYGHCVDMMKLTEFAAKNNCIIIEDASQSHGTKTADGFNTGFHGRLSAFSLYPGKNLGAAGDAGIVTTNDESLYKRLLKLRNLGSSVKFQHDIKGCNNRLDTIQAIILDEKLKYLDEWNNKRIEVANRYSSEIQNPLITLPKTATYCSKNTYHVYPILVEDRKEFVDYLEASEVQTGVHYPVPIELSPAYAEECTTIVSPNTREYSRTLASLPIHPFMKDDEIQYVIDTVNSFSAKPRL